MVFDNPAGTDGFEFVEYCSPEPTVLENQFQQLGFKPVAQHKTLSIVRYQQGDINFLLNTEPQGFAANYAKQHGPSACAMAFRVHDAKKAFDHAIAQGAKPCTELNSLRELPYPAIYGIGDTLLFFIDQYGAHTIYEKDFTPLSSSPEVSVGLTELDHLTHNVPKGEMDGWFDFYKRLFNFREIRYFDIKGKITGLISRALTSPCGKIRIPLNEPTDEGSQIAEFIREFNGSGIQHIALSSDNIYDSVEALHARQVRFLDVPDTYYEMIRDRVPWHQEDEARLHKNYILLDGTKTPEGGLLLQIFTETMLGPVFFEVIQRKGNEGFGEGNFKALFESIERDQMRRGVL